MNAEGCTEKYRECFKCSVYFKNSILINIKFFLIVVCYLNVGCVLKYSICFEQSMYFKHRVVNIGRV